MCISLKRNARSLIHKSNPDTDCISHKDNLYAKSTTSEKLVPEVRVTDTSDAELLHLEILANQLAGSLIFITLNLLNKFDRLSNVWQVRIPL